MNNITQNLDNNISIKSQTNNQEKAHNRGTKKASHWQNMVLVLKNKEYM